jgi:hypothetical protein
MSLRKLLWLCLAVVVLVSATMILVLQRWTTEDARRLAPAPPPSPVGAYLYVTEDALVVMRPGREVVRVKRLSDSADSAGYKTIWTRSGRYVAMLSDTGVRQDDSAETALIVVEVGTGRVERLPCAHCDDLTAIGEDSVLTLAYWPDDPVPRFLTHDLRTSSSEASPFQVDQSGLSVPSLLVSSHDRVIVGKYIDGELLTMSDPAGGFRRELGHFRSNAYMPAAVSGHRGADAVFAVAFRAEPGTCGPFPIHLFRSDGEEVRTDMSNVIPGGRPSAKRGLDVNDLWWEPDGHFHASIDVVSCDNPEPNDASARTVSKSVWRLDGTVWLRRTAEPALTMRRVGPDTEVALRPHDCDKVPPGREPVLYCNSGALILEHAGKRTPIADDVLTVSTPATASGALPAASLPPAPFDARSKFAPFVGQWTTTGYKLTVRADRTGEVTGINHAPGDSRQSPGPPDYREHAVMSFRVSPAGVVAHMDSTFTPNRPGSGYGVPWYATGQDVPLTLDDTDGVVKLGSTRFCAATAMSSGLCG